MTQFTPSPSYRGRPQLRYLTALLLLGLLALLAACGNSSSSSGGTTTGSNSSTCPSTKQLTGAGSTFDNPLFSKMFQEYPKVKCGINVNYQAVGSGAGINNLLQHIVDFGATDAPMTTDQLNKSTSGPILHIPITIGAVAISYNLSGVSQLKLTGPILAAIYEGKITSWDDPQIKAINSGVNLPHKNITVVHRSDGSGTTSIFTHYLSAISPDWQSKVGAGTTVNWPTGVGAKGSSGVAGQVKNTDGAIGYVELTYVLANNIPYALLQNAAGKFVAPSLDSAKADAESFTSIPADLRFYIVNGNGDNAYPITGFSWVVVYQNQSNSDKGQALARLLWWMVHDGQQYAQPLNYVPLPDTIVSKDEAQIKALRCGSSACYSGS
ncbi:phosphate ABC transporter substrate-binding protein PstS [Thermogemmatispora onikobensis]|uniref:phosphate ABC transporter substrate-binding protein PstS n=1 Tax=Thermogemmatispora onikobensis TaxID=732234 RepID=UPI000853CDB3|nr:phosphate ABC transporter substrate-binding protein PstS [Thermogemmatispora onikobensis]